MPARRLGPARPFRQRRPAAGEDRPESPSNRSISIDKTERNVMALPLDNDLPPEILHLIEKRKQEERRQAERRAKNQNQEGTSADPSSAEEDGQRSGRDQRSPPNRRQQHGDGQ